MMIWLCGVFVIFMLVAMQFFCYVKLKNYYSHENQMCMQNLIRLRTHVSLVSKGVATIGQQLGLLENSLNYMENKVSQESIKYANASHYNYPQVDKLLSMGASIEDLMQTCGLTMPEAKFMLYIHKNKKNEELV